VRIAFDRHRADDLARRPGKVIVFYYDAFADWSEGNRTAVKEMCRGRGILVEEVMLEVASPPRNWTLIQKVIARYATTAQILTSIFPRCRVN